MGAGAVVAAAAAARAKRVQHIIDAFRLADATAPSRARPLAKIGAEHNSEFEALADASVLVAGPSPGTWYLNEAAYVVYRDSKTQVKLRAVFIVLVLAAVLLVAAVMMSWGR